MQLKNILLATILPISMTLAACSGSGVSEDVGARQDTMKNWKDAMEVMGGMAKAPDTFDLATFQENAAFLAEDASTPWTHFSDQNDLGGATEAVWADPDKFQEEADHFQQVTAELNTTAQNASTLQEILPAFKPVADSCKSCHDTFKTPKE